MSAPRDPSPPKDAPLEDAAWQAAADLQTAFGLLSGVADFAPVPGLSTGLGALFSVIGMAQRAHGNVQGLDELVKRIQRLTNMVNSTAQSGKVLPKPTMDGITMMFESWSKIDADAKKVKKRNWFIRFWRSSADADALAGFVQGINDSINEFQLKAQIDNAVAVEEIGQLVSDIPKENTIPMYVVSSARYDGKLRTACFDGTRVDVLQRIRAWADEPQGASGTPARNLLWLSGTAGAGKSAIAYTLASEWAQQRRLGGSFFCSRDEKACRDICRIIPTLSYQLRHFSKPFDAAVQKVIKEDVSLPLSQALEAQFKNLLVDPITSLSTPFPRCAVIIDDLHECEDEKAVDTFLLLVRDNLSRLPSVDFVIASRDDIPPFFQAPLSGINPTRVQIYTGDNQEILDRDIEQYLDKSLENLKQRREYASLPENWPERHHVKKLVGMAKGLFVYAVTALGWIDDRVEPEERLKEIVDSNSLGGSSQRLLDKMYLQILQSVFPDASRPISPRVLAVIGAIVLIQDPLPLVDIAKLLGMDPQKAHGYLQLFRAVFVVPDKFDDAALVRVIHPTFADFLLDSTRCDKRFYIEPVKLHTDLALRCIVALRNWSPGGDQNDDALDSVAPAPAYVRYACRHLSTHLQKAEPASVVEECTKFVASPDALARWVVVYCALTPKRRVRIVEDLILGAQTGPAINDPKTQDAQTRMKSVFEKLRRQIQGICDVTQVVFFRSGDGSKDADPLASTLEGELAAIVPRGKDKSSQ